MERLIKPVEYAQELGISRQAVYAKIKRGVLQSKSVDGKLYIVINETDDILPQLENGKKASSEEKENSQLLVETSKKSEQGLDYEMLLEAKDETISVLKNTVKDLKKSNKQMSTTLRGEIDLMKEAFHEMRSMYVTQIEYIRQADFSIAQKPIEITTVEIGEHKWISLKKFFKKYKISTEKEQKNIIKKFQKAYKRRDIRILDNDGKMMLSKREDFKDILS